MSKISAEYIAGFFDGEGCAIVLTDRVLAKVGWHYRFRPTIKIVQKTRPVLDLIYNYFGFGTIYPSSGGCWCYQINGSEKVIKFVDRVSPYVVIKKKQLWLLKRLARMQVRRCSPMPRVEMRRILGIRDAVFVLNCVTRKNLKQKYPSGQIMSEHVFLDLGEFEKNRRSAMTEGMRHVRYAKIDRDLLKKLR